MKKIIVSILLSLTVLVAVNGQIVDNEKFVEPYSAGSQTFTMNGGLFLPLFFSFPYAPTTFVPASGHLSPGGTGSLEWADFISNRLSLGIELAGTFAFTPNMHTHVLIPLSGKISYLFPVGSFEIPVFFGAGIAANKVSDQVYFGPVFKPGVAAYWNMNLKWGFGVSMQYWIVPEIYFGDQKGKTAFGNFMDISFSARYHF